VAALYDTIGVDYANLRRPDPRIAAMIEAALGDAKSVVNVGAGAGFYEPAGRELVAVEPSEEMIRQRPPGSAKAVQARAECLPFADDSFDAALAVLTVHHWQDQVKGLAEMHRVARKRIVILTFDPAFRGAWQMEYWPQLVELDADQMPPLEFYSQHLGAIEIRTVPVPHDCSDGFLYAFWRRPHAYLDPAICRGSSSFWRIEGLARGQERLRADLESGKWQSDNSAILSAESCDMGYRLVVAELD